MLLPDIVKLIEDDLLSPASIVEFNTWFHREDPPNEQLHEELLPEIEKEWGTRFAGRGHDFMSQVPHYLSKDASGNRWSDPSITKEQACADGSEYSKAYYDDAQHIFSRVQHHFHAKTKTGYKPLNACLSKRAKNKCKHDFPMDRKLSSAHRIICRGNAKSFGVRIKGKRNQLGATMGRRTCAWQSGTSMALAVFSRSNTHTLRPIIDLLQ